MLWNICIYFKDQFRALLYYLVPLNKNLQMEFAEYLCKETEKSEENWIS